MTHLIQNLFSISQDLFILFCAIHYKLWMQHDHEADFAGVPLNSILAVRVGYLLADKMLHLCECMRVVFWNTSRLVSIQQNNCLSSSTESNTLLIFSQKEAISPSTLPNWLHVTSALSRLIPHVVLLSKTQASRRQLISLYSTCNTNSLLDDSPFHVTQHSLRHKDFKIHNFPCYDSSLVIPDLWFHVLCSWFSDSFQTKNIWGHVRARKTAEQQWSPELHFRLMGQTFGMADSTVYSFPVTGNVLLYTGFPHF